MQYNYSANTNSFYPASMREDYEKAGTWPVDAVAVDENIYIEFTGEPIAGKKRIAGNDGYPIWGYIPPLTQVELVANAEAERNNLLADAQDIIKNWQSELMLGIINDNDKADLILWLNYIKGLKALDVNSAPDVSWPKPPAT